MIETVTNNTQLAGPPATRGPARGPNPTDDSRPGATADRLELSEAALRHAADDRPIRSELVQRVRDEIASGEYLTDEKLEAALNGLRRDVLG